MSDVVERLRAKARTAPMLGGAGVSQDGKSASYIYDDGMRYVNPDGPEAADEIERLRGLLEESQTWLEGCHKCETFPWDGDQWLAAEDTLARIDAALKGNQ